MTEPLGRSVFVISLQTILNRLGVDGVVDRARDAHLSSIWIRAGRGAGIDANLGQGDLPALRNKLAAAGIALWGWHVPFCAGQAAARDEGEKCVKWCVDHRLAGMVLDAERTPESPRFRGNAQDAQTYSRVARTGLAAAGLGVAFSSHDQPQLHADLPFAAFLDELSVACPQIYDRSANPTARFNRSVTGYRPFLDPDFAARYRPTGNICTVGDVAFPDSATAVAAVRRFLGLVRAGGHPGHSFWCWEQAPDEVWDLLAEVAP